MTCGNRFSIVLYNPSGFSKALTQHVDWQKKLADLGYPVPSLEESLLAETVPSSSQEALMWCVKPGASVSFEDCLG